LHLHWTRHYARLLRISGENQIDFSMGISRVNAQSLIWKVKTHCWNSVLRSAGYCQHAEKTIEINKVKTTPTGEEELLIGRISSNLVL
jgi:hypothetical protein